MALPTAAPTQPIVINNHIQPPAQPQEVHLLSSSGGIFSSTGSATRFARQYPALLHSHISQRDLFAELETAESIVAEAVRGTVSPVVGVAGFLVGMVVAMATGFSSVSTHSSSYDGPDLTGVIVGFVICFVSMVGTAVAAHARAAQTQRGLDKLGVHLAGNKKYPALTFMLGYDRVLSTYRRANSDGFSRNELRVSRVPKITIQVANMQVGPAVCP